VIGWLRGTIVDRTTKGDVIVDVNGVGYRVMVPNSSLAALTIGTEATMHVHTHVREDALVLYGFTTRDARTCFEILIATHGVGPSLALAILATYSPDRLRAAVADSDEATFTAVPGIGKKTAARLLVELQGRFDTADFDDTVVRIDRGVPASGEEDQRGVLADVRAALGGLGYGSDEIRSVMKRLPAGDDAAALVRQALRLLADGS
jgi:holliday junction DNA helicase RuvA